MSEERNETQHVDTSAKAHEERVARIEAGEATDEDHRLVKQYRVREAQEKSDAERKRIEERDGLAPGALGRDADDEGGAASRGNSSRRSSAEEKRSGASVSKGRQSTARTTEPPSTKDQTDGTGASSTGGSGTAGR